MSAFANTPRWVLERLADRLRERGARKVPDTLKALRLLWACYAIAMQDGPKRRLPGAIRRAGAHGALAAQLGKEEKSCAV